MHVTLLPKLEKNSRVACTVGAGNGDFSDQT